MLAELRQLIDVQELDKEIREVTQALDKFPEELAAQEAELMQLEAEQAGLSQELEELQKQRRETETEVAEMESSIKKSRQRVMEIKSNIEYKAMLKEIAFKEDQRDQKETRILEFMEQIGARSQAMEDRARKLEEQRHNFTRRQAEMKAELEVLKKQLAGLERKRDQVRRGLPVGLLKRYEFIRERRNGTAIAEVREGVCGGCHMNILPQQFIDLQKGEEILQCPHCQRILYWLGEEEAGEESLSHSAS